MEDRWGQKQIISPGYASSGDTLFRDTGRQHGITIIILPNSCWHSTLRKTEMTTYFLIHNVFAYRSLVYDSTKSSLDPELLVPHRSTLLKRSNASENRDDDTLSQLVFSSATFILLPV